MSTTISTRSPQQIARAAVLGVLGLATLATVDEVVLTIDNTDQWKYCYCEQPGCDAPAHFSTEYSDREDGLTEKAACLDCLPGAVDWLRISDQVNHDYDIEIHVSPEWLAETHDIRI